MKEKKRGFSFNLYKWPSGAHLLSTDRILLGKVSYGEEMTQTGNVFGKAI